MLDIIDIIERLFKAKNTNLTKEDFNGVFKNYPIKTVDNENVTLDIKKESNILNNQNSQEKVLGSDVTTKDGVYSIVERKVDRPAQIVKLQMLTKTKTGISNKQLLTILKYRFRNNHEKLNLINELLK